MTGLSDEPRENAPPPMLVKFQDVALKIIDSREMQPLNALEPMDVTESGIVMDAREVQD